MSFQISRWIVFAASLTMTPLAVAEVGPSTSPTPAASATSSPELESVAETPSNLEAPFSLLSVKPWVALDVIGSFPTENANPTRERFRFRTLDAGARFDFDSGLFAVVDIGGRDSNGILSLRMREGFVAATHPTTDLRVGLFFLNLGLLNRLPQDKWPFPSAPLSQLEFFDDERAYDSGVEWTYHPTDRIDLGLGLTSGYWYGAAPLTGGDKPLTPTHYVRPALKIPVGDGWLDLAVDYVSRVDVTGERMRIGGFEAAFSRGPADDPSWLTMFEVNHKYRQPPSLALEEKLGGYLYNQARIDRRWSAGVRLDALTVPTLTAAAGGHRANLQAAIVPVATYRLTSSTALKSAYTYMRETRDGDNDRSEQRFELQFTARFDSFPGFKAPTGDRPSL